MGMQPLPDATQQSDSTGGRWLQGGLARFGRLQPVLAEAPPLTAADGPAATAPAGGVGGGGAATEPLSRRSARDSMSMQMGEQVEALGLGSEVRRL